MIKLFKRIILFFWPLPVTVPPAPQSLPQMLPQVLQPDEPQPEPLDVVPTAVPVDGHSDDERYTARNTGEFYFRETILDQLDCYFKCLKRMRSRDTDAFQLYRQIGACVIPEKTLVWMKAGDDKPDLELSSWFKAKRPAFGAVFYGKFARDYEKKTKDARTLPRFFYFTKYAHERPPKNVQRVPAGAGDVYVLTAYWDDEKGRPKGLPTQFPIVVGPDGSIRLLRTFNETLQSVRIKNGRERGGHFTINKAQWLKADPFLVEWATENHRPVEQHLTEMFVYVANLYETAQSSMIRVDVTRRDLTASFGVNIKRTPYFFKDRDVTLGNTGRKQRIFHIVRPHVRASGKAVKMHFRGLRDFAWNGYRVAITVPGKHHANWTEFDVGSLDFGYDEQVPVGALGPEGVGKYIRDHMYGARA